MARVVKEFSTRRNEILDAAQQFVYTKGYEQMTIQDILDALQISKGAFYHYFDSKQALLGALIERMMAEAEPLLLPIVHEAETPALEKFNQFFNKVGRWKTDRKTLFLALLRVWYADDNVLVRQKVRTAGLKRYAPMLKEIICQGIGEGVLNSHYPDQVAEVVFSLGEAQGDALAELFLAPELGPEKLPQIQSTVDAYTDAIERVLGAPPHSIHLFDMELMKEWVTVS